MSIQVTGGLDVSTLVSGGLDVSTTSDRGSRCEHYK